MNNIYSDKKPKKAPVKISDWSLEENHHNYHQTKLANEKLRKLLGITAMQNSNSAGTL